MDNAHPFERNPLLETLLPPRRVLFIVNPMAGAQVQRHVQESIDRHLNHRRFTYGIWYTERAGHAAELARRAVAEGYEIVVAVGGDGSINEVASALIGTEAVLGIVPAGSGNGLAMHLGYGRDIDGALRKFNTADVRTIDCGLLNGQPFFNIAGLGFDGLVSNLMKGRQWRGIVPYCLTSVEAGLTYRPRRCRIETDDHVIEETCFAVSIANGPMYGYNFQIAPDAQLDDGQLAVVLLKKAPRWQYFFALPASLSGRIYEASFVEHFKARRVRISSDGDNYVHIDGEGMIVQGDLNFEVRPKALKVLAPKS
jgi:diacylglycerol kinase (ATP)